MVVRVLAWALVVVGIHRHPWVCGGALLVVRVWAGVVVRASACALVMVGCSSPSMGWLWGWSWCTQCGRWWLCVGCCHICGRGQWRVLAWPVTWLATRYRCGWWWLQAVANGGGWWQPLVTVVTWWGWVVFDDGGGSWSLLPPVAVWVCEQLVFVVVGGHHRSPCGRSLSVVVCVGGGAKEKRSRKQTLFVIQHKYITNKQTIPPEFRSCPFRGTFWCKFRNPLEFHWNGKYWNK